MVGTTIVIVVASPFIAIALPALLPILWQLQAFYLKTSRQLRLLDLETKAPLFTNFLETLDGVTTIRALIWKSDFQARNTKHLYASQKPLYLLSAVQVWLQLVLDLMVAGLAVMFASLAISQRHKSDNIGLLGLAFFNLVSIV